MIWLPPSKSYTSMVLIKFSYFCSFPGITLCAADFSIISPYKYNSERNPKKEMVGLWEKYKHPKWTEPTTLSSLLVTSKCLLLHLSSSYSYSSLQACILKTWQKTQITQLCRVCNKTWHRDTCKIILSSVLFVKTIHKHKTFEDVSTFMLHHNTFLNKKQKTHLPKHINNYTMYCSNLTTVRCNDWATNFSSYLSILFPVNWLYRWNLNFQVVCLLIFIWQA